MPCLTLLSMMTIFIIQCIAVNDVESITCTLYEHEHSPTLGTLTFTLWFNGTIYNYQLIEPNTASKSYTEYSPQVVASYECSTYDASILIEQCDGENSWDAVFIGGISFHTKSGFWYGVKQICRATQQTDDMMILSDAVCANGYYHYKCIGIDTDLPVGFDPCKQLIHFDLNQPNQFISDSVMEDGTNIDPLITESCNPTIAPTDIPTVPPTNNPTNIPTNVPTDALLPTIQPTNDPIIASTESDIPTMPPTNDPTKPPTNDPTKHPTNIPTNVPTNAHVSLLPVIQPTNDPTTSTTKPSHDPDKQSTTSATERITIHVLNTNLDSNDGMSTDSDSMFVYVSLSAIIIFVLGLISLCVICYWSKKRNTHLPSDTLTHKQESTGNGMKKMEISIWLESIELHEYYPLFVKHGYASLKFIQKITLLSELEDIGITSLEHQKYIISHIQLLKKNMNKPRNISYVALVDENDPKSLIKAWCEDIVGLPQYYDLFVQQGFEKLQYIKEINAISTLKEIGIYSVKHQRRIMRQIVLLKEKDDQLHVHLENDEFVVDGNDKVTGEHSSSGSIDVVSEGK